MPSQRLMTLMTRRLRATSLAREPAAPEAAPQTRSDGRTSRGSAWQTWRTLPTGSAQATASGAAVPVGLHPGVLCDVTMMPITGYRYTDGHGYDLCQAAFDELPAVEQRRFERLDPPLTPRRAVVASVASVLLGSQLGALSPRATPSSSGGRGEREDEADLWELPPLSPAEKLVAAIFRPAAHMTL